MGARSYYVYILASRIGGTLYIGVTNDLVRRVGEHKLKMAEGFTKKHEVTRLVYFEALRRYRARDPTREAEEMEASLEIAERRVIPIAIYIEKAQSGLD